MRAAGQIDTFVGQCHASNGRASRQDRLHSWVRACESAIAVEYFELVQDVPGLSGATYGVIVSKPRLR
jgi:hypothetical protein